MMRPDYAACVAAILLKGQAPQPDPEDDPHGTADQFIKICDPKTQTVIYSGWHPSKFMRGMRRVRFIMSKSRHWSASFGGEDCQLPSTGSMGFVVVEAERADPDNPGETWWMQI